MATLIQIKRGTGTTGPLADITKGGELAYAQDTGSDGTGAKLFIQAVDSTNTPQVHEVGGKFYTDLTNANAADLAAATHLKTANELARRDASGVIAADIDGTASSWATARTVTFGGAGDVTGSFSIDGTGDVVDVELQVQNAEASELSGDVLSDSGLVTILNNGAAQDGSDATFKGDILSNDGLVKIVENGTDGTNASFRGDVLAVDGTSVLDSGTDGSDATFTGDVSGNASSASALSGAVTVTLGGDGSDATGSATFTAAGDTATIGVTLADSGVVAGTVGSTSEVPVLDIDSKGRVTGISTATIDTAFTVGADTGDDDLVAGGETLNFVGTSGEIETAVSNNQIQIGLPDDVTVAGNLTVNGTTTTINTANVDVEDSLVHYARANTFEEGAADSLDIGFAGTYSDGSQTLTAGLFRDASDGSKKFRLFEDTTEDLSGTNVVDTLAEGYSVATLVAGIEAGSMLINGDTGVMSGGTINGLAAAISVADGGTGASTHTENAVLFGNGTGAIQSATGSLGDVMFLDPTTGVPTFGALDGGTF